MCTNSKQINNKKPSFFQINILSFIFFSKTLGADHIMPLKWFYYGTYDRMIGKEVVSQT